MSRRVKPPRARSQEVPQRILDDLEAAQESAREHCEPLPSLQYRAGTYVGEDGNLYGLSGQRLSWFRWPGDC